ncbi:multicopper oxidase domain-containing protein [Glycomyces sp. NPDC046736]|uniref:multicopper oxidase family protein n=1 Tax=Glycomyces sp. NPDC046736 TaxID=3155615 RepID=UPI00340FEA64
MKRRKALKWTLIGGGIGIGTIALGGAGAFAWVYSASRIDTFGKIDFDKPLVVPPLAESVTDSSGSRVFDLEIRAGATQFKDGKATDTWGVNGDYLGPTIRVERGDEVAFAVRNSLDVATSIHWHGMHLPAVMDGGPHQMVEAGGDWAPQWMIDQPASTLWYHPHPHGETAEHVYRGLAGMIIIDDEESQALGLPQTYGVDDLPMVVQDKKFVGNNQMVEGGRFMGTQGTIGDEVMVNGTLGPYFDVTTRLVRLRLLNGSNARIYNFGFSDDRPFQLVATDGGLLPEAWETRRLPLSPGERAEIVVAFEPGDTVDLRSYPLEDAHQGPFNRFNGGDDKLDVCRFRAADSLSDDTEVPAVMSTAPDLADAEVAEERRFALSGFNQINGESMDMQRIDFGVREGTVEVWEVSNSDVYAHNFHVHDVQYQVLDVNGEEPEPHMRGWKDTIQLIPKRHYRIAMRFSEYTDPNVPYMYHCHILAHEDAGMMGQFVVLGEGEEIGQVPTVDSAHAHG